MGLDQFLTYKLSDLDQISQIIVSMGFRLSEDTLGRKFGVDIFVVLPQQ